MLTFELPIRTWAALDAALGFFRSAPGAAEGNELTMACQRLHRVLRRAGIKGKYQLLGTAANGKSVLRLQVMSRPPLRQPWLLPLPNRVAFYLAEACLTVLRVQTDPELGLMLDYEAEELQACRVFLTEARRQFPAVRRVFRKVRGPQPVEWDKRYQEYVFTPPVAERVHCHYLRVGAGVN
jgi:hypothetical protein